MKPLITSAMQKSIRRGEQKLAQDACKWLLQNVPHYPSSRLPLIGMEDVCAGNIHLMTKYISRQQVVAYAGQLAKSVKDRTACTLLLLRMYHPQSPVLSEQLRHMSEKQLSVLICNQLQLPLTRTVAVNLLAERNALTLGEVYQHMNCPAPCVELTGVNSLSLRPLAHLQGLAWHISQEQQSIQKEVLPAFCWVGSYPSYTFDMYTPIGRKALQNFSYKLFSKLMARYGAANVIKAVGFMQFELESQAVNLRIHHAQTEHLRDMYITALAHHTKTSEGVLREILQRTKEELPLLNQLRQQAYEANSPLQQGVDLFLPNLR
jgi:hypothetical protein